MKHSKATLDWYNRVLASGRAKPLAPLGFIPSNTVAKRVSVHQATVKSNSKHSLESILDIIHN